MTPVDMTALVVGLAAVEGMTVMVGRLAGCLGMGLHGAFTNIFEQALSDSSPHIQQFFQSARCKDSFHGLLSIPLEIKICCDIHASSCVGWHMMVHHEL